MEENKIENMPAIIPDQPGIEADFEAARKNTYDLIQKGVIALNQALQFAEQSEKTSGYEVVAMLIGQLSKLNEQLLDLNIKLNQNNNKKQTENTSITNNNLFVGTGKELNDFIEQLKGEKVIDVTKN